MFRRIFLLVLCVAALAGCGESANRSLPSDKNLADRVSAEGAQQFSYTHFLSYVMAHDAINPRYERARQRCLYDGALHCKLLSANISLGDGSNDSYSSAQLDLLLPHDQIEKFQKSILEPLPGQAPGDVVLRSRSTRAQSVEDAAGQATRKVAQLTVYRDRLLALSKRPNLSVDDVIKVESELSRVQGELDDAVGTKDDVQGRIAREEVNISFEERASTAGPLAQVWRDASSTFMDSTASALRFFIQLIPWLPVMAALIFFVSWVWRLFRRRQKAIVAVEKNPPTGG
ncbi:MAG: DUF4349 domain-containing protein [Proteobacteria bacterium]|nr:DUF4349 domain-containing protein [Pseudomonadota bacterium]